MTNESPFLRVRVSADLKAALSKAAKKRKQTDSEFVRLAIAAALGKPSLAEMREPGRPENAEKTKAE